VLEEIFLEAYPFALRAVQVRAAAAILIGAVPSFERADLWQEGLAACWRALRHYDPKRASLRTFTEHVIACRLTSLHRARCCRPRLQPLDDRQLRGGDGWARKIELRSDVHRVLATLQDSDRSLALLLIEHTPTEVSRLLGLARSTVYERIQKLRLHFSSAGLGASSPRR
jgi:RNA polymerase sigma factor (sigma-70 family)